jgi:hypothetical protein
MSWLYEQPLILVVVGILLLLGLGIAWSTSGRKELLFAAGLVLALVVTGLAIERLVVTDGEALRQTLQEIAHEVGTNNHRALLRHIADSAPELKQRAEKEMPNYQFTDCRVTKIHSIDVDASAAPKSAIVTFNVVASGSFRYEGLELNDSNVARWVQLHFVQDKDGRWKVEDYQHDDPQRMIMERPATP